MNPDRTVRDVQILDAMRMATDSAFRSAAESARRALLNPQCHQFPAEALPAERFDGGWNVITMNFDPKDFF